MPSQRMPAKAAAVAGILHEKLSACLVLCLQFLGKSLGFNFLLTDALMDHPRVEKGTKARQPHDGLKGRKKHLAGRGSGALCDTKD